MLRQATARAVRLTRMPPEALIRTKSLLRGILHSDTREQSKKEAEAFNEQLQEPEIVEAHKAFLEGRRPIFEEPCEGRGQRLLRAQAALKQFSTN